MAALLLALVAGASSAEEPVLVPAIAGEWWQVAGNPDLGEVSAPDQEPVDFAIWQAQDGTWQILSCIRKTREPGKGRVLHRLEGARLADSDWKPMGIAMRADPAFGDPELDGIRIAPLESVETSAKP